MAQESSFSLSASACSIVLMVSTKPSSGGGTVGDKIPGGESASSVDMVLWCCSISAYDIKKSTGKTNKKTLTYYHYEDHPCKFNHTDALLQRLHPIHVVHLAVVSNNSSKNVASVSTTISTNSSRKKKNCAGSGGPSSKEDPIVRRLLKFLQDKCFPSNERDKFYPNSAAASLEKVVLVSDSAFHGSSSLSSTVDFVRLTFVVQQLLGIDSNGGNSSTDDDSEDDTERRKAALLQFSGNTYLQQNPIVAKCLQVYLHVVENSYPNCSNDAVLGSYAAIGIQGHLNSHLILDSTAADAIHLWPPATSGQWVVTGGTKANNSIAGIVTSHACTYSGKRLLNKWLRQPLIDILELQTRQNAVHVLVEKYAVGRDSIRDSGLKLLASPAHDLVKLASNLKRYQELDVAGTNQNDNSKTDQQHQQQQQAEVVDEIVNMNSNPLTSTGSTRKALRALFSLYLVSRDKIPRLIEQIETALMFDDTILDSDNCTSEGTLLETCYKQLKLCCSELSPSIELCHAVLDMDAAPEDFFVRRDFKDELADICRDLKELQLDLESCHADMNALWATVKESSSSNNNQVRLESISNESYGDELKYQFRLPNTNDSKILERSLGDKVRIHRILKNGVYFSTSELRNLSLRKFQLLSEYEKHQQEIVGQAMAVAATYVDVLNRADSAIGLLDAIAALSHLAAYSPHGAYCRPILTDTDNDMEGTIELRQARHPCVELQENIEYTPNDLKLVFGQSSFLIVTGPNMGGKSTYIRALGAIVTLAQIGSYVPCKYAKINICHHILARVGAGDLQERGISTFMAEMLESSSILRTATKRSLIIIDELGRGTSTFDGYGLARAISEYIVQKIGCLTVFATHFHELTAMEEFEKSVKNCHVTAHKGQHGLTFLYEVKPGPCLESFGIQVAEMANVPAIVIRDAKRRARELENFEYRTHAMKKRQPVSEAQQSLPPTCVEVDKEVAAKQFLKQFQQIDIPKILSQNSTYLSDDDKRQAILRLLQQ